MKQLRQEFLTKVWERYPEFPSDFDFAGRIQSVDLPTRSLQLQKKSSHKLSSECDFPLAVLEVNDWVAIKLDSQQIREIVLLAPCLQKVKPLHSRSDIQKSWNEFLQKVRNFFVDKSFLEIQTPSLVVCPGTEPFLDVFSVDKLFLPTSPELHLKKAIAGGYENIFEMRSCFRKGEVSKTHQPEFQMLEWYRSFENLQQIKQDCQDLIRAVGDKVVVFKTVTMKELFRDLLGFDLTPETTIEELKSLAKKLELNPSIQKYEIWDDVFFHIFVEKIEPFIDSTGPVFLEKYPPSQAALARLTADGWGDRFELYWKGMELANAFHELNDPQIQRQRFQEDLDKKKLLGKMEIPIDTEFIQALEAGMPPSAGIALGLERLFMALNPGLEIQDLKVFPYRN